jgi:IS4 transposase
VQNVVIEAVVIVPEFDASRTAVVHGLRNADYGVVEELPVPQRRGVWRDQVIFFYKLAQAGIDAYFRRIEFYDEEQDRVLVFLTNHLDLVAATIAEVYKERWQIELFFRALKQSLRVKTFVGTSANALKTQLWTALIAMLLVKYLQLQSSFGWSQQTGRWHRADFRAQGISTAATGWDSAAEYGSGRLFES